MKRSGIRDVPGTKSPDSATLHPGYAPIVFQANSRRTNLPRETADGVLELVLPKKVATAARRLAVQ
jgi:hypothetical protein